MTNIYLFRNKKSTKYWYYIWLFSCCKEANTKIEELQQHLYAIETNKNNRTLIKETRWLLSKNQTNLFSNSKEILLEALTVYESLYMTYYLKKELKLLWGLTDIKKTNETEPTRLLEFSKTLKTHRAGIFNWYQPAPWKASTIK
jgi:hypothetical protein